MQVIDRLSDCFSLRFAMQGAQGYDPKKKGYKVSSIKGKSFKGKQILAFYYVSWSLAILKLVSQLRLSFDKEFELARMVGIG